MSVLRLEHRTFALCWGVCLVFERAEMWQFDERSVVCFRAGRGCWSGMLGSCLMFIFGED